MAVREGVHSEAIKAGSELVANSIIVALKKSSKRNFILEEDLIKRNFKVLIASRGVLREIISLSRGA